MERKKIYSQLAMNAILPVEKNQLTIISSSITGTHIGDVLVEKQILIRKDDKEQYDHQFFKSTIKYHDFHI